MHFLKSFLFRAIVVNLVLGAMFWVLYQKALTAQSDFLSTTFRPAIEKDLSIFPELRSSDSLALHLFMNEDFKDSGRIFEKIGIEQGNSSYLFYAGVSYLGAGRYKKANELLSRKYKGDVPEKIIKKYREMIPD